MIKKILSVAIVGVFALAAAAVVVPPEPPIGDPACNNGAACWII